MDTIKKLVGTKKEFWALHARNAALIEENKHLKRKVESYKQRLQEKPHLSWRFGLVSCWAA